MWSPCEICGDSDGGDRFNITAIRAGERGPVDTYIACRDCLEAIEGQRRQDNGEIK